MKMNLTKVKDGMTHQYFFVVFTLFYFYLIFLVRLFIACYALKIIGSGNY